MAKPKFGFPVPAAWITCAAMLAAFDVKAAPQVLALITTDRPVAMQCGTTHCRVELPTLCLQPERRAPQAGRDYRLSIGQTVVLSGRSADGATVSIPVNREIRFTAQRTHVTVEARVARRTIAQFGLAEPAIGVTGAVAVVPVAKADDAQPLTAREIGEATTIRRGLAVALVDGETERMPAVRLTNRLINELPVQGKANPIRWQRLWTRLIDEGKRDGTAKSALERARFNVSFCTDAADSGRSPSLRRCLQGVNDDTMEYLNTDLESALKTGS